MGNVKTIAKVSEETLKIQGYIEGLPDGEKISYSNITHNTGVTMDTKGKAYLRRALKRAKREYSSIRAYGIELADEKSTMAIVAHKLTKIDRAVKRGEKTQKNLQEQFFSSLKPQEQKELLYIGAVFGAIRVAAENGKIIYSTPSKVSHSINIPLPDFAK